MTDRDDERAFAAEEITAAELSAEELTAPPGGFRPLSGPLADPNSPGEPAKPRKVRRPAPEQLPERPVGANSETSDESVVRTGGSIALATLISRITGFIRTVLLVALLGGGVASAFQAAYVLPNMIAEVVLGAVLTAIVIPVLVRAESEDPDGGEGFINRLYTLTVVLLGSVTVLAVIAAPILAVMNVGSNSKVDQPLTTALAYLLLPEILFYGLSALFMAILNVKNVFKPGAWAPVLNNIVQIATLVLFRVMPGELTLNPVKMTNPQLLVLGIGTTLGVVVQAVVLLPYLRRAGVRFRLKWGLDARLRTFGNMAAAIVVYVLVLQVGLVITNRIAAAHAETGIIAYATHWQLLQLPYGVLGVTILTALMPRLSRNAAADDTDAVKADLSLATRLTMVSLVPVVAFMTFFGPYIGLAIFSFGKFSASDASQLGSVLAWGAFTLIPYAMTLVQLRVFYAREDAWTPTAMVVGITVVKVASSFLGPVLFDDPDLIIRWLALSNGLGYLVGAIVGHYLLRSRLGNEPGSGVARTTLVTLVASLAAVAATWALARLVFTPYTPDDSRAAPLGERIGVVVFVGVTAIVALALAYVLMAAAKVPDVVAVTDMARRAIGRFVPALAPKPDENAPTANETTLTVQFPKIGADESLPYSGQVEVVRRFDRGSSTWRSYTVHSGGATTGSIPRIPHPDDDDPARTDMRYRRRGMPIMSDGTGKDAEPTSTKGAAKKDPAPKKAAPASAEKKAAPAATAKAPAAKAAEKAAPAAAAPVRGPRLVPGAAVAGGRYRLIAHCGGARGLQFWHARDINLDRDVALTFVDADQVAEPPKAGAADTEGPQAILSRTLRIGHLNSAGAARVLDVIRGSSGGIVVSEWTPGSSLAQVAGTNPSPRGAARAVRALAAAAEAAHRTGGALSIDSPDRIRVSTNGDAVLAFPGTLAGDDKSSDVRGLGAVLYALLLDRWPLSADASATNTEKQSTDQIGGMRPALPDDEGKGPIEPQRARSQVPFEISAVAARALAGNQGIRTAATIQHVLDQATVVDLPTTAIAPLDSDGKPIVPDGTPAPSAEDDTVVASEAGGRNMPLLIGLGVAALLVVISLVIVLARFVGGSEPSSDIDAILTSSTAEHSDTPGAVIPLQTVAVVDYSDQPADPDTNVQNVISGKSPSWATDHYQQSANFGGLKPGVGLMFNLGGTRTVRTVTIKTPNPGFKVELRTAQAGATKFDQTTKVADVDVDNDTTTIKISNAKAAPFMLLWIKRLAPSQRNYGQYEATIQQVIMKS
ncbi:MAG: murein biosynthesis integral membrane protein MurJ [Gordonia sp. (in: high G+C Gram-positive bacteria)]|uniref:murein biosynthesis integral membrane protein MurJ n=1 Tax=Gordonia sp. (in: high G+C Gram-positive bacteria) TaxID=84139 RepID=UPI0039E57E2A